MLSEFLEEFREEILSLANEKTVKLAGSLPSSKSLRGGMPVFYQHLINFLKQPARTSSQKNISIGAADHGKELLRLHYSLSHVVHSYGAMCQAITELAHQRKAKISSREFNELNLCLDIAIASAVSEFQFRSEQATHAREVKTLGMLVHELRNSLSSATIAHDMIKQGLVGVGGSTSRVLEENLDRMRILIDQALSEVRLRTDPQINVEKFIFRALVDQILLTAQSDALKKNQVLTNEIDSQFEIRSDRQLLLSILANLVQNAIKYSRIGGKISVTVDLTENDLIFRVTDECGGIKPVILKNLFNPFVSGSNDRSGLGLGLNVVERAVSMIQGKLTVENKPGVGCSFVVQIPQVISSSRKKMISGRDSVQPRRKK